ncbi:MAG: aminotransferase class V-fold PLP-dependent enzyme [Gammaproteobacteria bacterium]|nr:aminotransferase class V-fold PLP-dependent enzyme [Gammaproteobacteria bacterium]
MEKDLQTFTEIFKALRQDEIDNPLAESIEPEELLKQLDLSLGDEPMEDDAFNENLKALVLKTPKTASNRFYNQLFAGRKSRAILGELLAAVLNNSMYTYKVGGPQVCIEKEIIEQICGLVGYDEGSGGTFPTGGSMANFMGLLMARDHFDPDIRDKGMQQTLIAYSSTESHYSMAKNATFAGIGRDNVRYIAANGEGKMRVDALEKQIKADLADGLSPFFVNATAGTTVLGTYDPIQDLADICKHYNLWLHVDGALGSAVMFSQEYKHLLAGVDQADSFSFNAHKMLGVPLSCSMIFARDKQHLYQSFSNDADYLYQGHSDDYNLGKISIQCGRRNDALKFWTLWKSVGTKGLAEIVDYQFQLSALAHQYIENNPDYTVYSKSPSVTVCFNYKEVDPKQLCTDLYEQREIMVGYGSQGESTFIRSVAVNTSNNEDDVLEFFKVLEDFCDEQYNKF